MKAGIVFPKSLVIKMNPQMQSMVVTDAKKSLFYGPINLLPASFSAADTSNVIIFPNVPTQFESGFNCTRRLFQKK
jgi:uncharacterized protein (DUF885 family)